MDGLIQNSFSIHLKIMRALGFYPTKKCRHLYKIYAYAVYFFLTVPVPSLAVVHLLTAKNLTLAHVSNNAFMICQVGCFIFKMLPFVRNPEDIRRSIYMLETPVFLSHKKEQENILKECFTVCKMINWINLMLVLFAFATWSTTPLFRYRGSLKLPMEVWLPYDPTVDRRIFYFTYLWVAAGVGNGAFSNGVIDPLIAGLACHATAQFKILKNNLQFLAEYTEEKVSSVTENITSDISTDKLENMKANVMYEIIRNCIKHHTAIINFIENYEKTYSLPVFTQFVASVLVICNACLQMILVQPFTYPFFAMIFFLICMLAEIFLYSYYGTLLYEEVVSNTVTDAIYMGKWYDYDVKTKHALLILMERTKKPIIITAGKILESSLVTFTTILRRAYSLLAVLKNFQGN